VALVRRKAQPAVEPAGAAAGSSTRSSALSRWRACSPRCASRAYPPMPSQRVCGASHPTLVPVTARTRAPVRASGKNANPGTRAHSTWRCCSKESRRRAQWQCLSSNVLCVSVLCVCSRLSALRLSSLQQARAASVPRIPLYLASLPAAMPANSRSGRARACSALAKGSSWHGGHRSTQRACLPYQRHNPPPRT